MDDQVSRPIMRWLIFTFIAACAALCTSGEQIGAPPTSRTTEPRQLFIALDAVPYDVVRRISDPTRGTPGIFADFTGPVPLISTFPSTTSLALGGMLEGFGLDQSAGYEHRFYDRRRNRKRGGGLFSYRKPKFPWRRFFDCQEEGVFSKGLKLLRLQASGRRAVDKSLTAFAASDQRAFHVYHDLTDLIGHVKGPDALEPFLHHLALSLRRLRDRPGTRPFHTVIYSDHGLSGGEPLRNVRRGIKRALRRGGWQIAGRIHGDQAVVLIPYGLVSSLVAFTAPGREVALTEVLTDVEGIDLCAAPDGDGWRVTSSRGNARVLHQAGDHSDRYAYQPLTGDPLGYAQLTAGQAVSAADWRSDAWWFEATRTAPYPDALYRIVRGFDLVENPASVICSVAEGHMYGGGTTVFGSWISTGKLRWTHGSMAGKPSLGFVMSNSPGWQAPDVVRFDRALTPWTDRSHPTDTP